MATLNKIQREERDLVISLPYRVGIWISQAEDESGEKDDKRERKAIEKVLHQFAGQIQQYPFISAVLRETLAHRDQWPRWAENSLDIIPDCEKALLAVRKTGNTQALANYRKILMKIANDVAGAHGEFGTFEGEGGLGTRLLGLLKGRKNDDFMNVSPAEDSALDRLAAVLRLKRHTEEP